MPTAAAARVAAVIPTWNRRDLLATLLRNLAEQARPFEEIIVVDNGSEDDSAQLATAAGAKVLKMASNLGFAAAVNRRIEATDAGWVARLNNQLTLAPQWRLTAAAPRWASGIATPSGESRETRSYCPLSILTVSHGGRLWPDSCFGDCSPCGMGADRLSSTGRSPGCAKRAGCHGQVQM